MADNLSFLATLDITQFEKDVQKAEKLAKQLNTSVSSSLQIMSKIANQQPIQAEKLRREQLLTAEKVKSEQLKQETSKLRNLKLQRDLNGEYSRSVNLVNSINNGFSVQNRLVTNLKTLFTTYVSLFAAKNFVVDLSRIRGEFELTQKSLQVLMNDVGAANLVFSQLKGLAIESPYSFKELSVGAKQLSAYNIESKDLFDSLKRIADLSAGTGVEMNRLILAYGQVRSAEFLRGQEVRQFSEAGINIVGELAKKFGELEGRTVSAGEVFDRISKRMVTFNDVKDVIEGLTNEGGKFFDMQRKQAETLFGKISNLRDAYEAMMNDIGRSNEGVLKSGVDALRWLMQNWEGVAKAMKLVLSVWAGFKMANMVSLIANLHNPLSNLIRLIKIATTSARGFSLALNTIGKANLIIGVLTTLVGVFATFAPKIKNTTEVIDDLNDALAGTSDSVKDINTLVDKYESLSQKTERTKDETEELVRVSNMLGTTCQNAVEGIDAETKALILNTEKLKENRDAVIAAAQKKTESFYIEAVNRREDIITKLSGKKRLKSRYENDLERNAFVFDFDRNLVKSALSRTDTEIADLTLQLNNLNIAIAKYDEQLSHLNKISSDADPLAPWQKAFNTNLKTLGVSDRVMSLFDFQNADYQKTSADLRAQIKDAYDSATEALANAEKDKAALYKKATAEQKKYLDESLQNAENYQKDIAKVANAFGVDISDGEKAPEIDLDKQREDQIKAALQSAIDAFDTYVSKYDFFKDLIGNGVSKEDALAMAFGNMQNAEDIKRKVLDFVNGVLRSVNQEGVESIDLSFNSLPLEEQLKGIWNTLPEEAKNALGKVENLRQSGIKAAGSLDERISGLTYLDESGEGWTREISKMVNSYTQALAKISNEERKMIADLYAQRATYTDAEFRERENKIRQNYQNERDTQKKLAQERLDDLAKSVYTNALGDAGLSSNIMQDWGNKNFAQIETILSNLRSIPETIKIDDETLAKIKSLGLSIVSLNKAIAQLRTADIAEVTTEKFKKIADDIQSSADIVAQGLSGLSGVFDNIGGDFSEIAGSITKSLGGLLGSLDLESFANWNKTTTDSSGNTVPMVSGLSKVSAIASVAMTAIQMLTSIIVANEEANRKAARAAFEYGEALNEISRASRLEQFEGLFGTNIMAQLSENAKIAKDSWDKVYDAIDRLKSGKYAELLIKYNISDLGISDPTDIISDMRSGWQKYWGMSKNMISLLNSDIYDELGNIDVEKLSAWFDAYSDGLTEKNKEFVEGLINDLTAYEDAMTAITDHIREIFGNLASDIAEKMIDSFEQTGHSATNLEDIFKDIGKEIVQSLLESLILEEVLNKHEDNLSSLYQEYARGEKTDNDLISGISQLLERVETDVKNLEPVVDATLEYAQSGGLIGAEDSQSLGGTIKGITENTAELLGSYLNAIRQFVAIEGNNVALMQKDLSAIYSLVGVYYPTCAEYLMKIESHNAKTAEATQSILKKLSGIISTDGRAINIA